MIVIDVPPGKYVVAVSGGVDSMVLLDLLAGQADSRAGSATGYQLIVAHFDHGIRPDSDQDRLLVEAAARRYGLPYIYERGHLGADAGEARAREARYMFLGRVKQGQGADAIVTAHHQDDMLETAIINVLRGTGRKGLSSLGSGGGILRPLLHVAKDDIYAYARSHNLAWREDVTNADDRYVRNYIRHHIIGKLGEYGRELLLDYITKAAVANPVIDAILLHDIQEHTGRAGLERRWFTGLPYDVSAEVMAAWLRSCGIREFDRRLVARLVVAAKTARPGKRLDINAEYFLNIGKDGLQLDTRTPS